MMREDTDRNETASGALVMAPIEGLGFEIVNTSFRTSRQCPFLCANDGICCKNSVKKRAATEVADNDV